MSEPVIRVENLSKKYIIDHQEVDRHLTLRDTIMKRSRSLANRFSFSAQNSKLKSHHSPKEEFWALKDVSFEIQQGDRVGIIGRNGAGKSTLLKILSRITEPTSGRIQIKGRVASLLEVGTGFHGELSGRENIFLNGAILGMSKAEIQRKFDEIVAFSEVEKFLDTPVKRYSSGMYVRLAFAVAAFLEPEILIVDEVLAVGDAAFQKKCLGKMQDISTSEGRTILFVSHNTSAIHKLCTVGALLINGRLVEYGNVESAINKYLARSYAACFERPANLLKPSIVKGAIDNQIMSHSKHLRLELEIYSPEDIKCSLDVLVTNQTGDAVGFASIGTFNYSRMLELKPGTNEVELLLEAANLAIGQYNLSVDLTNPNVEYFDRCANCLGFEVIRKSEGDRVLDQAWNYGCIEFQLHLNSQRVRSGY